MSLGQLATTVASYTHPGRRRANQDAVMIRRLSTGAELIAVADGMGGHAAGEVASVTALEVLIAELEGGADLESAVRSANRAVFARARARAEWEGMGTTLVALLRDESGYSLANVGDSRAYRVSSDGILQITHDHSYVVEALQCGAITQAEAELSPWRNALTRAIGTDAEVEIDLFGPFAPEQPHAVLLCSDGLYKTVPADILREYVLSTGDLATASEALGALAFRRGSDDNISLALIEFRSLLRRSPSITLPLPIQLQTGSEGSVIRASPEPPAGPSAGLERVRITASDRRARGPVLPAGESRGRSRSRVLALFLTSLLAAASAAWWWYGAAL
jgi:PPM family protein phosphatase